jgi:hypothetical protein
MAQRWKALDHAAPPSELRDWFTLDQAQVLPEGLQTLARTLFA